MNNSQVLNIWDRIVLELATLQDIGQNGSFGQVLNPICYQVYDLDTACAAKVFAVEYQRTGNEDFQRRAISALDSISSQKLTSGLPEPIWDSLGWHEVPGSLAATGMALDVVLDAEKILGYNKLNCEDFDKTLLFLSQCYNAKGRFAHNCKVNNNVAPDVQNTTAVGLYLLEHLYQNCQKTEYSLFTKRELSIRHLYQGQNQSGYWSYSIPKYIWIETILSVYPPLYKKWRDFYNAYRDILHHVMTLYFVTRYFEISPNKKYIETVYHGWDWLKNHINICGEEMVIDWSFESVPASPCYCNLRDTNTYFWIMALLPHLNKMNVITKSESDELVNGITKHIKHNLMSMEGEPPCIVPHEGPPEILRNILPMFDQGVAWKGAFLADLIMDSLEKRGKNDCSCKN